MFLADLPGFTNPLFEFQKKSFFWPTLLDVFHEHRSKYRKCEFDWIRILIDRN